MNMQQRFNTAVRCFQHNHAHRDKSPDVRRNCGACALMGYEPRGGWGDGFSVKRDGPNYAGWARVYVEAVRAIPKKWEEAFRRELRSNNKAYARALWVSILLFGVRFGRRETVCQGQS